MALKPFLMMSIYHKDLHVADTMGRGQPSCQEEWKMCRKKKLIVRLM